MRLHVKVCGLRRQEDLDCAAFLGVDLCGFIFVEESPRSLTPGEAAMLDSRGRSRVGVVTDTDPDALRELMRSARLDMLQFHGDQTVECMRALKLPPERIIRTLWPLRYDGVKELERDMQYLASVAGMFLLDAGSKGGGSGNRIALDILKNLRSPRPWIVAGGLAPENVTEVVLSCADPNFYGVDFNSGLETAPGCKNKKRMKAAMDAICRLSDSSYGKRQGTEIFHAAACTEDSASRKEPCETCPAS